jgi:hypothetical protein
MKNIHVLPTDKPSRLSIGNNKNFVFGILRTAVESYNNDFTNQHIYITSDEEIKEGDWFYAKYSSSKYPIYKCKNTKCYWELKESKIIGRKIILTTDQDLIKDGVQSIIDEFLEWFVSKANDSGKPIDIVEVEMNQGRYFDYGGNVHIANAYKIIIPYEEPKQRLEKYSERFDNDDSPIGNPETWGKRVLTEEDIFNKRDIDAVTDYIGKETSKQETLEEVDEIITTTKFSWEQERSYSEEDVKNAFLDGWQLRDGDLPFPKAKKKWFEQFKNK